MRLSDKDKKLLVLLLLVSILALTYYYVYTPFVKKLDTLKEEVAKLETDYNMLQGKAAQKNKLESKMKFVRFELNKLNKTLPADILQDKVILILKDLSDTTGIKLEDLAFTEAAPVALNNSQNKPEPTQQQKLLEQLSPQEGNEVDKKAKDGYQQITDNTGIVMEVKAKYTADYEQIKDFLAKVMNFEQKITVSDITFSKGLEDTVSGSLKISFYGFKDSTQEITGWDSTIEKGKDNIFSPYEGYIETDAGSTQLQTNQSVQNSQAQGMNIVSTSDFYLSLGPSSHDVPTVILNKTGKINSTIYGDGNEVEKVEIHIDYKDGKYLYKYKTSYEAYPSDTSKYEEFMPKNESYMVLQIFSKDRLDEKDLSGVNIDIYNNTPIRFIVKHKDDSQRPRAQISIKIGDVGIVNEQ